MHEVEFARFALRGRTYKIVKQILLFQFQRCASFRMENAKPCKGLHS